MVSQLQVTLPLGNCGLKACSQKVTNTDLVAVTEVLEDVQSDFSDYGIDDDGPSPALQTGNEVSVPQCPILLSDEQSTDLERPLETISDDMHGIYKYLTVVDFLESLG